MTGVAILLVAGRTASAAPQASTFPDARAAVVAALAEHPDASVVAFGEIHQRRATAGIPSALARFTRDILPAIAPRLSYLVVETWVTTGRCGPDERAAVAGVERATERPKATGSEIVDLLEKTKALGVSPQILTIGCAAYRRMVAGGDVDVAEALRVTADALTAKIDAVLAAGRANPRTPPRRLIAVYGGALHNDLYPDPSLARFAFGPHLAAETHGGYVEIDLYVPEYVEALGSMRAEAWYPVWRRAARPGRAVLLARGPSSYIVVFPRSNAGAGEEARAAVRHP